MNTEIYQRTFGECTKCRITMEYICVDKGYTRYWCLHCGSMQSAIIHEEPLEVFERLTEIIADQPYDEGGDINWKNSEDWVLGEEH